MHDLVIATLQESGVDGAEGREALTRKTSCECHSMLLRDSNIKDTVREVVFKPAGGSLVGRMRAVPAFLGF
jgi:hypothetical protein